MRSSRWRRGGCGRWGSLLGSGRSIIRLSRSDNQPARRALMQYHASTHPTSTKLTCSSNSSWSVVAHLADDEGVGVEELRVAEGRHGPPEFPRCRPATPRRRRSRPPGRLAGGAAGQTAGAAAAAAGAPPRPRTPRAAPPLPPQRPRPEDVFGIGGGGVGGGGAVHFDGPQRLWSTAFSCCGGEQPL